MFDHLLRWFFVKDVCIVWYIHCMYVTQLYPFRAPQYSLSRSYEWSAVFDTYGYRDISELLQLIIDYSFSWLNKIFFLNKNHFDYLPPFISVTVSLISISIQSISFQYSFDIIIMCDADRPSGITIQHSVTVK